MMHEEFDYEYEYDENGEIVYYAERPNKTKIKKEIAQLFSLAEEVSALSPALIDDFILPENINKSLHEVSGMPHKGARKRLLKYIAGLLYKADAAVVTEITEKLARIKNKSAHAVREHHLAERWRDRLVAEGNDALTDFLDEYPNADRQQLRQLVRNAQKEIASAKPPKSSRLLYRYLKELLADDYQQELAEQQFEDQEDIDAELDDEFDEAEDYDDDDEDYDEEDY